jgi:acetamidase/formamidase
MLTLLLMLAVQSADTVRFTPTIAQPTFAVREPVARLKPGTVLISRTNHGPYYTEAGGAFPGEVGPFFIEGATTNDMLKVGLASDSKVRMLNDPIKPRRYLWRLDTTRMTGTTDMSASNRPRMEIDLNPMLGRVAVAPAGAEAFAGLWPGDFGGNMDAPEVREGTTVYLPVFHDGAYFYFGDGHARQGEGEVAGTGLETSMDVIFRIDVIKGKTIDWPRLEDANYIMVAGSGRPLIDAFRLAHIELIEWMQQEYRFDKIDAYALLSQVAESTVANIVDPAYTVIAKINKRYLR